MAGVRGGGGCDKRLVTTALSKPLCYESVVGGQQLGNRDCRGVTYRLSLISLPLK